MCTKREVANYDLENNDSRNVLGQWRLELCDFYHKLYIALLDAPETLYLSRFFPIIAFVTFASS